MGPRVKRVQAGFSELLERALRRIHLLAPHRTDTMTIDVLHFIDNKGGNAEEIRESQRKRGLPVEIVDEVIQMYTDWVKRTSASSRSLR